MSDSIKVGAGVVIIKNGMTLLAKRHGSHAEGCYGSYGKHYIDVSFVAEILSGEPTIMEPHKI